MKDLHPLDVRNRDGGLPTAQAAQPRSLRPAHKTAQKPARQSKNTVTGPWGKTDQPAPNHGVAHGNKPSPELARKPTPATAPAPRPRRRSRLPFLIFLGVIGYWAYVNFLPVDFQDQIRDQIKAVTK